MNIECSVLIEHYGAFCRAKTTPSRCQEPSVGPFYFFGPFLGFFDFFFELAPRSDATTLLTPLCCARLPGDAMERKATIGRSVAALQWSPLRQRRHRPVRQPGFVVRSRPPEVSSRAPSIGILASAPYAARKRRGSMIGKYAKFCNKILVGKLLTRSTRFTCFCTAQTSIFPKFFVKLFRIFWQKFAKFRYF